MNPPPPDTKRWVIRRKMQVVDAVKGGIISFDEACRRYCLSKEELDSWLQLVDGFGIKALRATHLQQYR